MNLSTIGQQIVKYAPTLGKALMVIPGGQIPGGIITLLAEAFGGATPAEISTNIAQDPEAEYKLKQLEFQHAENILTLQNQTTQQEYQAVESARGWVEGLKWFVFGLAAWGLVLLTVALIASIFTNVIITTEEKWLIAKVSTIVIPVLAALVGLMRNNK